jgi:hypothetical protein
LKHEKARLVKKNIDLKSERGELDSEWLLQQPIANLRAVQTFDAQLADDFAGLGLENRLKTPTAKDVGKRLEDHKLQAELAATAARNDELSDTVKSLEEENAALEENLKEIQANFVDGPSTYHIVKGPDFPEETEEVAHLKELVDLLDIQNAQISTELNTLKTDPLEHRFTLLQDQLKLYKVLLTQDRFEPGTWPAFLAKEQEEALDASGIHRHNPAERYVSSTYFNYSQAMQKKLAEKAAKMAVTPTSAMAFDAFDRLDKEVKPKVQPQIKWENEYEPTSEFTFATIEDEDE